MLNPIISLKLRNSDIKYVKIANIESVLHNYGDRKKLTELNYFVPCIQCDRALIDFPMQYFDGTCVYKPKKGPSYDKTVLFLMLSCFFFMVLNQRRSSSTLVWLY